MDHRRKRSCHPSMPPRRCRSCRRHTRCRPCNRHRCPPLRHTSTRHRIRAGRACPSMHSSMPLQYSLSMQCIWDRHSTHESVTSLHRESGRGCARRHMCPTSRSPRRCSGNRRRSLHRLCIQGPVWGPAQATSHHRHRRRRPRARSRAQLPRPLQRRHQWRICRWRTRPARKPGVPRGRCRRLEGHNRLIRGA